MATVIYTQKMLDEARLAYHQLQTGTLTKVFVDQNGERVEFVVANRADLYAYIQEMATALGVPGAGPAVRRPLSFTF